MEATRLENKENLNVSATEREASQKINNIDVVNVSEQIDENAERPPLEIETEQVRKLENELNTLATDTPEVEKKVHRVVNVHAEQKPKLKPLDRLRNNLIHPSSSFLRKTAVVTLGADAAATLTNFAGIQPEIHIPILAGAIALNGGFFAELFRAYKETTKVNDLLKLCKVASPVNRVFQDGSIVNKGEMVGELHMEGANVKKEWKTMSEYNRGKAMIKAGLDSLMSLAQLCKADSEHTKGISAFYGTSDIIHPEFMKKIGFEVAEANSDLLTRFGIKMKRVKALGLVDGLRTPVGKLHEAWITRDALINSTQKIEHYQDALLKRSKPPVNTHTPTS